MEGADGAAVATRDELVHLLEAAMPVPPERADHAGGELAALGERSVRVLGGRRDPGVLPSRDAEGVEVLLREEDRPLPFLARRRRQMGVREGVGGALVQGAGGLPVAGSRSIRPSHGSGVSRVMCPTSNAFEFTHAPWTSRFSRKTGRSGTMSSSRSFVGVPPGKWAISQPPPKIDGSSGCSRAYAATASRYASTPGRSWSDTCRR